MEEVIEFEAFGQPAIVVVSVDKTPWLQKQLQVPKLSASSECACLLALPSH
jgi:hypothetical protein